MNRETMKYGRLQGKMGVLTGMACVCVCVCVCVHVYVVYEDTNLHNDMGMT